MDWTANRKDRQHVRLGPRASRPPAPPKGWHSRGYLPHLDAPTMLQSVTFRLADSLPAMLRAEFEQALAVEEDAERRRRIESCLDLGRGSCVLRNPRIARLVEDALIQFDGVRYYLLAWVIMPNHVHVLIQTVTGHPLSAIVHAWKSFTAKRANALLGTTGTFWQPDYYDRYIRDDAHLAAVRRYIDDNPVKAGWVSRPEEWPFGSARFAGAHGAGGTPAAPG